MLGLIMAATTGEPPVKKKANLYREISALEQRRVRAILKHDGAFHLGIVRSLEMKIEALRAKAVVA
jgi:hypothetical protein